MCSTFSLVCDDKKLKGLKQAPSGVLTSQLQSLLFQTLP